MKPKNILIISKHVGLEYYKKEFGIKRHQDKRLLKILRKKRLDVKELLREYNSHHSTLDEIKKVLDEKKIKYFIVDKAKVKKSDVAKADLIMPVGGDGTFLEASHYITDARPVFGVNSDPKRSRGVFMSAVKGQFKERFELILENKFHVQKIRRTEVTVYNDRICKSFALNEVFAGKLKSMQMARYYLTADSRTCYQQSSGVVVAMEDESRAWLMNIPGAKPYGKKKDYLQFVNREPKDKEEKHAFNQGFAKKVIIKSDDYNMIVSIDSNEREFLFDLNKGHRAVIQPSNKPLHVIKVEKP